MFCGECGARIESGAGFCPECGSRLGGEPAQARRSAVVVWAGVLAGVLCVTAAVGYWFYRSQAYQPAEATLIATIPEAGPLDEGPAADEAPAPRAPREQLFSPPARKPQPLQVEKAPARAEVIAAPEPAPEPASAPAPATAPVEPPSEVVVGESADKAPPRARDRVFLPGADAYSPPQQAESAAVPKVESERMQGRLYWSGKLEKNRLVVYQGSSSNLGQMDGDTLPGKAVKVQLFSPAVEIVEAPSAANGWKKLSFRALKSTKQSVTVSFEWTRTGG